MISGALASLLFSYLLAVLMPSWRCILVAGAGIEPATYGL